MEKENQDWLDAILKENEHNDEIGPDQQAVDAAGLTHPDELEFERIVQETIAENWGEDFFQDTPASSDPDATQFFTPQQEITLRELAAQKPADIQPDTGAPAPKAPPAKKKLTVRTILSGLPGVFSTLIWIALILFIGATLGRTAWLCAVDLLALGKTGQEATIIVEADDSIADIALKLENAGMIRYAKLFEAFASVTGKGEGIDIGPVSFTADTIYDYNALIYAMSYDDDPTGVVSITIPEGYTCAQIFALLEEKGVCKAADLEQYSASGELTDYWFLQGVQRGSKYCLEGYLFPDTYEFYIGDEPKNALEKLLDGFDYRFSDILKEKFENLKKDTGLDLTLQDAIIMASMVQKEKATDLEGYTIASAFYNRLTHTASFPFLNCDSTILYATEVLGVEGDAQINASPYNTYTQEGLPPGPICNPGLSSLDAALEPEDTGYYYFALNKETNRHVFAKTYDEHQRNLQELGYYD